MIKELTAEKANENKYTYSQCVQYYFKDMPDKEANDLLWEHTCFPFDIKKALSELYDFYLNNSDKVLKSKD